MTSDLEGATELGFPNALAAGPGEFAARWNAHTEEERDAWLSQQQHAASVAVRCEFIEAHREQLRLLQALPSRVASARFMLEDAARRHREGVRGDLLEDVHAILAGPLASDGSERYTVELGGQVFTAAQWEAVQVYAQGTTDTIAEPEGRLP